MNSKLANALAYFEKQAARISGRDPFAGLAADTVGRAAGLPNLIMSGRSLHSANPQTTRDRVSQYSKIEPDALRDVVVRTDGSDFADDYLWQDDPKKDKKWHQRLGGRVWQNPRTSLPMKLLATAMAPGTYLGTNLTRASHYDPTTNAVNNFGDEPSILEHELGHAVDFNQLYGMGVNEDDSYLRRFPKQLARDGYTLSANIPFANLWHEAQANRRSAGINQELNDRKLISDAEHEERKLRRTEVLPAGYGSYLASHIPIAGGLLSVPGMLAGKAYGLASTAGRRDEQEKEKSKESRRSKATKKAEMSPSPGSRMLAGTVTGAAAGGLAGAAYGLPGVLLASEDEKDMQRKRLLRRLAIGAALGGAAGGAGYLLSGGKR